MIRKENDLARFSVFLIYILCVFVMGANSQDQKKNVQHKEITFYVVYNLKKKLSPYGITGLYFRDRLAAKHKDTLVKVENTTGSLHTLLKLEENGYKGKPSLGIVQSDVLYHHIKGNHTQFPGSKGISPIRAVAKLYKEWLFITFKPPKNFEFQHSNNIVKKSLCKFLYDDFQKTKLKDCEICGGEQGAGQLVTALNINRILDLNLELFKKDCIGEETQDENTIRFFTVSPKPHNAKVKGGRSDNLYNLYMTDASVLILTNAFSNIYQKVESSDLEKYMSSGVSPSEKNEIEKILEDKATISVDAVLVATSNLEDTYIKTILKTMKELDEIEDDKLKKEPEDIFPTTVGQPDITEPIKLTYKNGRGIKEKEGSISKGHIYGNTKFHRAYWTKESLKDFLEGAVKEFKIFL
jgi:TRAP-type uncharacterized transport system substrate-binding protein